MISATLFNIGVIAGLWGFIWLMLDNKATGPGWLLSAGLLCFLAGGILV